MVIRWIASSVASLMLYSGCIHSADRNTFVACVRTDEGDIGLVAAYCLTENRMLYFYQKMIVRNKENKITSNVDAINDFRDKKSESGYTVSFRPKEGDVAISATSIGSSLSVRDLNGDVVDGDDIYVYNDGRRLGNSGFFFGAVVPREAFERHLVIDGDALMVISQMELTGLFRLAYHFVKEDKVLP